MPATAFRARVHPIERIVRDGDVRAVFQPIVALGSGEPVGYEALARGPEGTDYESPMALFGAAHERGLVEELEWACRAAAIRGALDAGLPHSTALFLNVEPNLIASEPPPHVADLLAEARGRLRIVFEITERALTERPADLLRRVERLRAAGGAIAIDDVGADPRSLALMPFLEPDVIKLDMRLVQAKPSAEIARIVHAVSAEAERSGARVVAEGIETEAHAQRAAVLGADLAQGWLFGRPAPLPEVIPSATAPIAARARLVDAVHVTPFDLVAGERTPRVGTKRLLLDISREIEERVAQEGQEAVLVANFQEARHFTVASARKYEDIGRFAAFVGALGHGLGPHPVAGVRGGHLAGSDPLRHEWNVVVVGPHFAAAFVGRDLGDDCADMERRFEFALTHDRALAIRAAAAMIARITPLA